MSMKMKEIAMTSQLKASQMNAWSVQRYGGPEQLAPISLPIPKPGPSEVLIQVHASAVTRADGMMRSGKPKFARLFLGFGRPRNNLVGTGLSGEVVAVGDDVSTFKVGEQVFGEAGLNFGANATHICLPADGVLMRKPTGLSHEIAAVLCDGPLTSFNFLNQISDLKAGEKILILGGAGSLGSAAVQIAVAMDADVTATCSAGNAELVASFGAQKVIDYTQSDFTKGNTRYDVIFDTVGVSSFSKAKGVLSRSGQYISPVLGFGLLGNVILTSLFGKRKARFSATGMLKPDALRTMLSSLLGLIEEERLIPFVDRTYPLPQLMAAHRYVETGRKRGNVVILNE